MRYLLTIFIFLFWVGTSFAESNSQASDWIQVAPGFEEKKIGAKVHKVETMDKNGLRRVEISIPERGSSTIEEVIVTGKAPKPDKKVKYQAEVEVIKDLDAGRTGIVIYLDKEEEFKLRINYIDYTEQLK